MPSTRGAIAFSDRVSAARAPRDVRPPRDECCGKRGVRDISDTDRSGQMGARHFPWFNPSLADLRRGQKGYTGLLCKLLDRLVIPWLSSGSSSSRVVPSHSTNRLRHGTETGAEPLHMLPGLTESARHSSSFSGSP